MKKRQMGVSLSGLLFWCVIVAMVAVLLIKVAPSAIEYYKIRKDIVAVAHGAKPDMTVADLRRSFMRHADIDMITDVKPEDLDIGKEGNQIVISVAYEKRISLFGPVSLVIDYRASSADR